MYKFLTSKKNILGFAFSVILISSSLDCRKKVVGFDMFYRRTFNISVGLDALVSHNFNSDYITPDTAIFFQANNVTSANILGLLPKSMQLRAIYPGNNTTFDILAKVEVSVFDNLRPNLPEQIIFYRDDVPLNTGYTLDLLPLNVDVKDVIINSKRFLIKIKVQLRQTPLQTIETEWNMYFTAQTQ